jgi:hypothetical protein
MKKNLKEAVGVPENIHETSEKIYKKVFNWVKNLKEEDLQPGVGAQKDFRGQFQIADYPFSTVRVKIGVEPHKKISQPELMSMSVQTQSKKTEDFKLETIKSKTVNILILILVPKGWDYSELPSFFEKNKNEILENFSHELKHAYDHHKKEFDNMETRAIYQGVVGTGIGIDAVDRFIHDIYFTSANENLVRPSEVLSAIKANKISQKDFLNFLTNHTTYQNFKRIQNFNFEQFTQEILSKPKQLDRFLKKLGLDPTNMKDKDKVRKVLEATHNYIVNTTISNYGDMLKQSIMDELIGFQGQQQVMFRNFIKKVLRFKKPEEFYKYYEKQFKYVADEMIRKISKVYSLVDK